MSEFLQALAQGVLIGSTYGLLALGMGLLYGVRPHDPITFVAVAAGLLLIALLASILPARRATRVSPTIALRG